ncbi:hypothetical protein PHISP_04588 [Aspergillus sp. HF37]|nr:hypothetical protein PHISP_04588 [Aspergillus sp. HF37]
MSLFEQIPDVPLDSAFAMIEAYKADTSEKKANLSPGIYRDENAKTWVLPSVKEARTVLQADQNLNHDITPQMGHPDLVSVARQIIFKDTMDSRAITSMQTISGTGANHFIARLLSDVLHPKSVWLSDPSWENHAKIWRHVNPAIEQRFYPYYDYQTSTLDIGRTVSTLREQASKGDTIVLQACAHNPTGLDPSRDDWEAIAEVCEEKELFPIFDSAYQGFATGDADNDAWAIRHFTTQANGAIEFAVAQSFSKNFGLYGERVGVLHVVTRNRASATKLESILKTIARAEITSSPGFGAKVVATIMQTTALREQWQRDLETMSGRLRDMRRKLYDGLTRRATPGNWGHLLTDAFGVRLTTNTQVVQLAKNAGFDSLFIDLEHSSMSIHDTNQLSCAALLLGITPFVRVPYHCGNGFVQRVLDSGAMGVIFPHIHSAQDAKAAVSISKYPPVGTRSMTGQLPTFSLKPTPQDRVIQEGNASASSVILMVETRNCIRNIEEIAAVECVDMLLVGCNDLAIELGLPGGFQTAAFRSALESVSQACRRHDKIMGLAGLYDNYEFQNWAVNTLHIRYMLVQQDSGLLASGAAKSLAALPKVIGGNGC